MIYLFFLGIGFDNGLTWSYVSIYLFSLLESCHHGWISIPVVSQLPIVPARCFHEGHWLRNMYHSQVQSIILPTSCGASQTRGKSGVESLKLQHLQATATNSRCLKHQRFCMLRSKPVRFKLRVF